jgi:molybdopterin-synthase adenylyltransferase
LLNTARYSRQILFAPIGEKGQRQLQQSRVAIAGLGALGTALANHMVRSGVGYVRLIDRDFVEESNLQRQMLYDENDAREGLPKAVAAKQKLQAVNSEVTVEAHVADIHADNAEALLTDVDLILDGTDNFGIRYLINDVSLKHTIPWIYGGAVSSRGMTHTFLPGKTPCLRCLFPQPPEPGSAETCDTAGVIGPIVQIVASLQATEALKLLTGNAAAGHGKMRHMDIWYNQDLTMDVSGKRDPQCPACVQRKWEYLDPRHKREGAVSLCGRNTIQISPSQPQQLDLSRLSERLKAVGKVEQNPFLLRLNVDDHRLVIFPDGRILVQGTDDPGTARSLAARYVGL